MTCMLRGGQYQNLQPCEFGSDKAAIGKFLNMSNVQLGTQFESCRLGWLLTLSMIVGAIFNSHGDRPWRER